MHAKALKKEQMDAQQKADLLHAEPAPKPNQVDGVDFKLLYYGSKFFWRSQDNIDISLYHHVVCDCIEIVPYDVYKNREMERLYLSNYMVLVNIEVEIKTKLAEKKELFLEAHKKDRFGTANEAKSGFADADEHAALQRVGLTTFILSRLQLHSVTPDKPMNTMDYIISTAVDDPKNTPLLASPPSTLIPVSVTHRRNTSTEEVNKKMVALAFDQAALSAATSKAEKIAGFVHQFASNFRAQAKKIAHLSALRKKWILAIRKVRAFVPFFVCDSSVN